MEENNNKKLDITNDTLVKLLNEIKDNVQTDRTLALDRFRRQDDAIDDSPESFMLQGKYLCELLRIAADQSNKLIDISKLISNILHKTDSVNQNTSSFTEDDIKRIIQKGFPDSIDEIDPPDKK